MTRYLRILAACIALGALGAAGAAPARAASDAVLLQQNPDLAHLSKVDPERYRKALSIITAAQEKPAGGGRQGTRPPLDASARDLIARNPALGDVLNASPEAMHDLLQLIRQAASKGSGQVKN